MLCQHAFWVILPELPLIQAPFGSMGHTVSLPHPFIITATAFISGQSAGKMFHQSLGTIHTGDIYLGWGLEHVPVHLWDLLHHRFGPIAIPLPPRTTRMRQKLFGLLCGSVVALTWVSETQYTPVPSLVWETLWVTFFAPGLSGAIKSWHHVNTARQYSLTSNVRNFWFANRIPRI